MSTSFAQYASAYESVSVARRAVGDFAQSCGFREADLSDIVLAVGEACSNAVEHGHASHGHVAVRCTFERNMLRVAISDGGHGFDGKIAHALNGADAFGGRGRGIPIMRALMDRVRYHITSGGTTVVLEKRCPPSARGIDETSGKSRGLDARDPRQAR